MIAAIIASDFDATITYQNFQPIATLTAADFTSFPSDAIGNNLIQGPGNDIDITFAGEITGDDSVTYNGSAPGVKSPDTQAYS